MNGALLSEIESATEQCPAETLIQKAIESAATDPGAPFEPDVIEALAAVRQNRPADYLRYRQAFKKASRGVLLGELDRLVKAESGEADDDSGSIADILVTLVVDRAQLFTDESKAPFAAFEQNGHREVWPLESSGFREWLSYAFFQEYGKAPRDASIKDALATLAGIATHEGKEHPVYLRCAVNPHGAGYLIDLCDDDWSVIEVTPSGWRVLGESPVMFQRTQTMRPLPLPEPGGNLSDLWQFANIAEQDRGLVVAWMLEAYRSDTPFPVLEIGGEQGSAKSTTQSRLRDFIDPSSINLRAAPKTDEDIFVSAARNWLASYNNLSHLSASRQDALCTLATGGGYGGRKLFTNAEESVWEAKRPLVINGISTLVTAPDLLDRTIRIEAPRLRTYISEAAMSKDFEKKRSGIFGALLDLFAKALAILPDVSISRPPRMTDFAHFGEAVYRAAGHNQGTFLEDYQKGRQAAVLQSLESSPVAGAIIELIESRHQYAGTVGELLRELDDYRPNGVTGWPKSAKGLSDVLKRYAPPLRLVGIAVDFEARVHGRRQICIYVPGGGVEGMEMNASNATNAPKTAENPAAGCGGCVGSDEIRPFYTSPTDIYTAPVTSARQEPDEAEVVL